ncbi:MAG: penicillin-binding protein 1C [Minisyncoccus archaeiphilus]|jgi:membrane carboxypeptidase/penicillin-binding protein PbpC|uniref:transglycosylase domain-containing protein n=1 Tax=Minisyncoccus archaeiphilus TaxID=3238481 RepID=UPI002B0CEF86|nr:MAG: penicillin-binding protein 1C [Candidatus Parcubacteria bacterium]
MKPIIKTVFIILAISTLSTYFINKDAIQRYENLSSNKLIDRHNEIISLKPNPKGYIAHYESQYPQHFKNLLLQKEDRYFYYHPGINPVSVLNDLLGRIGLSQRYGSSTIHQQLAKNLLSNENERDIKNKILELAYAISINIWNNKQEVLNMYLNSAYFGNQLQGLNSASRGYFDLSPNMMTDEQNLQLISSLNSPTTDNPSEDNNIKKTISLSANLKININQSRLTSTQTASQNIIKYKEIKNIPLELEKYIQAEKETALTIDKDIDNKIKESIKRNIELLETQKAKNAAVIVISFPNNEIISMTGSPDPTLQKEGYQINMLEKPRQIGSTIKPFIYLKGFEKDVRPYTILEDKEYKFTLADNSPFYPKNYDYQYHGNITAHYALSNSINVPALLVLNHVGVEEFERFLEDDLAFEPHQNIKQYQLGIAMGTLEMTPKELAHIFTIFPKSGEYQNLAIIKDQNKNQRFEKPINQQIADIKYIQLINKILSDRKTGIDQFSASSSLNLPIKNYALKTGTSHDYTDSWIVGYTPDFLVAVWVGNADASETEGLSGQKGAGIIWNEIMQIMINSPYHKNTPFDFSDIKEFYQDGTISYGLPDDEYEKNKYLLKESEKLITWPQNGDIFKYDPESSIALKSEQEVDWYINDKFISHGNRYLFKAEKKDRYKITASLDDESDTIFITVD